MKSKQSVINKLQAECDAFNAVNIIGADVFVQLDGVDTPFQTKTRSSAQILSGHSAVIWLENVSGCYLLDRVTAIPKEQLVEPIVEFPQLRGA